MWWFRGLGSGDLGCTGFVARGLSALGLEGQGLYCSGVVGVVRGERLYAVGGL